MVGPPDFKEENFAYFPFLLSKLCHYITLSNMVS